MYNREHTPERISALKPNEIFVFGSNLAGMHGGGAARIAYDRFGAIWGQGVGLQGQSYAIPTMQGGVEPLHKESLGMPRHVGQRTIDDKEEEHHEEHIGREAHTLGKRACNQ